jgi:folate-binding protein YgfZ
VRDPGVARETPASAARPSGPTDRAAREGLAWRVRDLAVIDVEGSDRESFLQGQLTADVRSLAPGEARPAAALTPRGKLIFLARLSGLPEAIRLFVPGVSRETALAHLAKYAVFQKATISDRSAELAVLGLYGPEAKAVEPPAGALRLSSEGEFASEILLSRPEIERFAESLRALGAVSVDPATAEILRVEAGRPRFGQDAGPDNFPDEVSLESSLSRTKGCYVGQEIVARMKTYGRVNRRLVRYRFPEGPIAVGERLKRPEEPDSGKIETGRVTSSVHSPAQGDIGLGFAFRDVGPGDRLVSSSDPSRGAIVSALPAA